MTPQPTAEIHNVRRRYDLLAHSDWTELPSNQARKSAAWRAAWAAYRQAVRDVDLQNPVWPSRPGPESPG